MIIWRTGWGSIAEWRSGCATLSRVTSTWMKSSTIVESAFSFAIDGADRLRDGIYVLRRDDALLVKRIAPSPASRRIMIKSDNSSYPSWPDCAIDEVDIIGRVVWVGRRLR